MCVSCIHPNSFRTRLNTTALGMEYLRKLQRLEQIEGYYSVAICVANIPFCIGALLGNSAILITIWKTPSLHSPAYILLASLAVTDFAIGLIAQPLLVSLLLMANYGSAHIFQINCLVFNLVAYFLCGVSFTTITVIGLERLLALRLHLRYNSIITTNRVKLAIVGIWFWGGLCSLLWLRKSGGFTVLVVIGFVLLVANFVIYFDIALAVRRHQAQIQPHQSGATSSNIFNLTRLKKSTFNIFLVFILLIFCYVPQMSVLVAGRYSSTVYYVTTTIAFLNSSLNPPLYCWRVRELRSAMKQRFCG